MVPAIVYGDATFGKSYKLNDVSYIMMTTNNMVSFPPREKKGGSDNEEYYFSCCDMAASVPFVVHIPFDCFVCLFCSFFYIFNLPLNVYGGGGVFSGMRRPKKITGITK